MTLLQGLEQLVHEALAKLLVAMFHEQFHTPSVTQMC